MMSNQPVDIGQIDITPGKGHPSVSAALGNHRQGSYVMDLWDSNGNFIRNLDHGAILLGETVKHSLDAAAAQVENTIVSFEYIITALPAVPDPNGPFSITMTVTQWSPQQPEIHVAGSRSYSGQLDANGREDGIVFIRLT